MIYQYDQALAAPSMDIYDTGMLRSYIDAVKGDYERGLADQKEFMTKYGDFTSPISKDVEWWNSTVNKPIHEFVSKAAESGIDMRSPEFRLALSNLTNRMPYGEMNLRKQYAKNAEEYKKNRDYLRRLGKFNADFERSRLGGHTLEDWDTSTMGGWQETSPEMLIDLTTFSKDATKGLKPGYIRSDDQYDYTGVSEDRVRKTIGDKLQDFLNTPSGKYYLNDIAAKHGYDMSEDWAKQLAEKELFEDAVNRSGAAYEIKAPNEYAMLAAKAQDAKDLEAIKHQYDKDLLYARAALPDSDGGSGSGGTKRKYKYEPVGTVTVNKVDVKKGDVTQKGRVIYTTGEGGISGADIYYATKDGRLERMYSNSKRKGDHPATFHDAGKEPIKIGDDYYLEVTPHLNTTPAQKANLSEQEQAAYTSKFPVSGYGDLKTAYLKVRRVKAS